MPLAPELCQGVFKGRTQLPRVRQKEECFPQSHTPVPLHDAADIQVTGELRHVLAHRGQHRRPGFGIVDELADRVVERQWLKDAFEVVGIRPAMRPRSDLDRLSVAPRKGHAGRRVGRHHHLDLDLLSLDRPPGLGQAVGGDVPGPGTGETTSRIRPDSDVTIRGSGRCQTSHCAVQPVGDSSQGVVVERRHRVWIDRAIGPEAIPALPDGGRSHRHRVEPRRAALLLEQMKGGVVLPNAAQSITN